MIHFMVIWMFCFIFYCSLIFKSLICLQDIQVKLVQDDCGSGQIFNSVSISCSGNSRCFQINHRSKNASMTLELTWKKKGCAALLKSCRIASQDLIKVWFIVGFFIVCSQVNKTYKAKYHVYFERLPSETTRY
jgi:hypothetical protein